MKTTKPIIAMLCAILMSIVVSAQETPTCSSLCGDQTPVVLSDNALASYVCTTVLSGSLNSDYTGEAGITKNCCCTDAEDVQSVIDTLNEKEVGPKEISGATFGTDYYAYMEAEASKKGTANGITINLNFYKVRVSDFNSMNPSWTGGVPPKEKIAILINGERDQFDFNLKAYDKTGSATPTQCSLSFQESTPKDGLKLDLDSPADFNDDCDFNDVGKFIIDITHHRQGDELKTQLILYMDDSLKPKIEAAEGQPPVEVPPKTVTGITIQSSEECCMYKSKILDNSGKPISGCKVGVHYYWSYPIEEIPAGDESMIYQSVYQVFPNEGTFTTNANGEFTFNPRKYNDLVNAEEGLVKEERVSYSRNLRFIEFEFDCGEKGRGGSMSQVLDKCKFLPLCDVYEQGYDLQNVNYETRPEYMWIIKLKDDKGNSIYVSDEDKKTVNIKNIPVLEFEIDSKDSEGRPVDYVEPTEDTAMFVYYRKNEGMLLCFPPALEGRFETDSVNAYPDPKLAQQLRDVGLFGIANQRDPFVPVYPTYLAAVDICRSEFNDAGILVKPFYKASVLLDITDGTTPPKTETPQKTEPMLPVGPTTPKTADDEFAQSIKNNIKECEAGFETYLSDVEQAQKARQDFVDLTEPNTGSIAKSAQGSVYNYYIGRYEHEFSTIKFYDYLQRSKEILDTLEFYHLKAGEYLVAANNLISRYEILKQAEESSTILSTDTVEQRDKKIAQKRKNAMDADPTIFNKGIPPITDSDKVIQEYVNDRYFDSDGTPRRWPTLHSHLEFASLFARTGCLYLNLAYLLADTSKYTDDRVYTELTYYYISSDTPQLQEQIFGDATNTQQLTWKERRCEVTNSNNGLLKNIGIADINSEVENLENDIENSITKKYNELAALSTLFTFKGIEDSITTNNGELRGLYTDLNSLTAQLFPLKKQADYVLNHFKDPNTGRYTTNPFSMSSMTRAEQECSE